MQHSSKFVNSTQLFVFDHTIIVIICIYFSMSTLITTELLIKTKAFEKIYHKKRKIILYFTFYMRFYYFETSPETREMISLSSPEL